MVVSSEQADKMRSRAESLAEEIWHEQQLPVMPTPEKKHGSQARAQRALRIMLEPVTSAIEKLSENDCSRDTFKKLVGVIRLVGEGCLEGRKAKGKEERRVWVPKPKEEEKARIEGRE